MLTSDLSCVPVNLRCRDGASESQKEKESKTIPAWRSLFLLDFSPGVHFEESGLMALLRAQHTCSGCLVVYRGLALACSVLYGPRSGSQGEEMSLLLEK